MSRGRHWMCLSSLAVPLSTTAWCQRQRQGPQPSMIPSRLLPKCLSSAQTANGPSTARHWLQTWMWTACMPRPPSRCSPFPLHTSTANPQNLEVETRTHARALLQPCCHGHSMQSLLVSAASTRVHASVMRANSVISAGIQGDTDGALLDFKRARTHEPLPLPREHGSKVPQRPSLPVLDCSVAGYFSRGVVSSHAWHERAAAQQHPFSRPFGFDFLDFFLVHVPWAVPAAGMCRFITFSSGDSIGRY